MRDTTLNLIALSVFGVTLLSLVGPLIHLSPVFPAIATVGLFGLVALDQVGLQGRVGNIVIDGFSWASPEHRQRVLYHEAGHFLVAHLLGIPVVAYSLNTWDAWKQGLPGQGGVVFDTQTLDQNIAQGQIPAQVLDRYCRVWMAGIAAEQTVYGDAMGGDDDQLKFSQLWQQMDRPATEGRTKQRWAALQAQTLIEANRSTFEALVEAMGQKQPVEVCQEIIRAQAQTQASA